MSIPTPKQNIGTLGEKIATRFLKNKNHKIFTTNYRSGRGEIDIISLDKKTKELVFVEVKSRSTSSGSLPEKMVSPKKRAKVVQTAHEFLFKNKILSSQNYRFDVVAVEIDLNLRSARVTHFKYI